MPIPHPPRLISPARLRYWRQRRFLTQRELAARVGCTQAEVSYYESGRVRPRLKRLRELVEALEIPEDEIMPEAEVTT